MTSPAHPQESPWRAWLRKRYDSLWEKRVGKIRAGEIEIDPVLQQRVPDRRRGLTVIGRPSQSVQQQVASLLRGLQEAEPDQYYYSRSEFHLTILSLFTATIEYGPFLARTPDYLAAVNSALRHVPPIRIRFQGVTVSPSTVMVQGFFEDEALNDLRDALRHKLRARGLAGGLDQRYRLQTAHMTVVRFRSRLRDSRRFVELLGRARERPFGSTTFHTVYLVENDWYMSRRLTRVVMRYALNTA